MKCKYLLEVIPKGIIPNICTFHMSPEFIGDNNCENVSLDNIFLVSDPSPDNLCTVVSNNSVNFRKCVSYSAWNRRDTK